MIGIVAFVLIAAAAIVGVVIYFVNNPEIFLNLGYYVLVVSCIIAGIAGTAVLYNKFTAGINPKRAEWITLGAFVALVPVLVGIALLVAFVVDAIHGPYGR